MFLDRLEKLIKSFVREEGGSVTVGMKPATEADAPLLRGMVADLYRVDGVHSIPEDHIERTLQRMASHPDDVAVFMIGVSPDPNAGTVMTTVGYAILTGWWSNEYGGKAALLDELYILSEHRGKGYGPKVMDLLEEHCRKTGVPAVYLEVEGGNSRAMSLYERRGYRESPRLHLYKIIN